MPTAAPTTRERLLDCAEELLTTAGYDAVSVRAICAAAGANVAAVHYHFGTKDDLVVALLNDRLPPYWAEQLDALGPTSTTGDVVDALLAPFVTLAATERGRTRLHLLGRVVRDAPDTPWPGQWTTLSSWQPLLGHLDPPTARRRWAIAFDLILTSFSRSGQPPLSDAAVAALRDFVVAGLSAPAGTAGLSAPAGTAGLSAPAGRAGLSAVHSTKDDR